MATETRIKIVSRDEMVAVYREQSYPQEGHMCDYFPGVQFSESDEDANAKLRLLLWDARKEGLRFRFWSAHWNNQGTTEGGAVLHLSFPTARDSWDFDGFLDKRQKEMGLFQPN